MPRRERAPDLYQCQTRHGRQELHFGEQGGVCCEQQLLSDARQKLAEQEGIREGDERNYARVLERLKPYQEEVSQHSKNIEQLRGELGRLK